MEFFGSVYGKLDSHFDYHFYESESGDVGKELVLKNNPKSYLVRTSRLYGPPGKDPKSKNSFVDLVLRLANEKEEIAMLDVEWTANTYVDDLARHLDKYIFSLPEPGIYHLVNQGRSTWYEWAKKIIEIKGLKTKVVKMDPAALPRPARRPAFSLLLNTKLPPMRDWEEALSEFLK